MKVLLVQKMAGISGSERYLLAILPALRMKNIDAAFLVVQHPKNAGKNSSFIAQLQAANVPVSVIENRWPISPYLIWRFYTFVRDGSFDLLQTNLIHADIWGACVKRFLHQSLKLMSVKHGYSESFQARHGLDPGCVKPGLMFWLTRWAARSADKVICISDALARFFVEAKMTKAGNTITVPYGFDFSAATTEVAAGGLRFGNPQIVVAGRLVPVKQHHLLIDILPELVREFPDLAVVMVGGGPLIEILRRRTDEMGLSRNVRWEGFRGNMHDYIRDSDLMIIPSSAEGFGLVVLEAWYHAKPVVAFDVPAINEIIESGLDGELVPPFDVDQMRAKVKALLLDSGRMRAMGDAGKRKQLEVYGLDMMCARTIAAYRG